MIETAEADKLRRRLVALECNAKDVCVSCGSMREGAAWPLCVGCGGQLHPACMATIIVWGSLVKDYCHACAPGAKISDESEKAENARDLLTEIYSKIEQLRRLKPRDSVSEMIDAMAGYIPAIRKELMR